MFASFFAFVAFAFAFQEAPPLFESIREEFDVTNVEVGLVMSMVLLPGIFLSLPAGFFVKKYGVKRIGFLALVSVVLGCFVTATANSFIMLLTGRMILGVGGAFIVTNTPTVIAQWFTHEELGKAMGIYGINMPLATIIAFPSASVSMLVYGWRFPFYIGLTVGIAATAVFVVVVKDGPFSRREKRASVRQAITNFEIWKVGLLWLFFNASALSFTTWAPELFETYKGIPKVHASFLASLLMWGAILCVPIFGWVSDRTGRRRLFAVAGSLLMALAFLALAYTSNMALVVSILALGITAAMVPPIASALPAEILGPTLASVGFGITGICLNLGATSAQPLFGFLLDVTESYTFCFLGMAALSAIGALVAYTLKTH
ncbi:MAG: MFS transporter [Candidatus Bathyarchaeaceae archaeon]